MYSSSQHLPMSYTAYLSVYGGLVPLGLTHSKFTLDCNIRFLIYYHSFPFFASPIFSLAKQPWFRYDKGKVFSRRDLHEKAGRRLFGHSF